ncbi:hypothetical protein CCZ01_02175 [Helicobacter monodelphidis]|uniref:sel1 repeat family protein n=1 Tax=Helicobacter sp. 15-1451 TaxID=2004995 RepID=UPI000DCBCB56|nr:sel1 repeat family protein [Helicobacter sp. 15-1451]RAX58614.1 hypothetical protein CCZ01_02175 [Helicobacter sp. 15-1451]
MKQYFLIFLLLIFSGCATSSLSDIETEKQLESELEELQTEGYRLFLQANLGSIGTMQVYQEACEKGSITACNESFFLNSKNREEWFMLCEKGSKKACFLLGEEFLQENHSQARQLASIQFLKACNLGDYSGCEKAGNLAISLQDKQTAFSLLKKSCEHLNINGCRSFYENLYSGVFDTLLQPIDKQEILKQTRLVLLDFGLDNENLICNSEDCKIAGGFAQPETIIALCKQGSSLACTLAAEQGLMTKDIQSVEVLLSPHCFQRNYGASCDILSQIYTTFNEPELAIKVAAKSCSTPFYPQGLAKFSKNYQICTRVGDGYMYGIWNENGKTLPISKDLNRAKYYYKKGCEREDRPELSSCQRLEKLLSIK